MIQFTKMNGLGNNYIYIDCTNGKNYIPEDEFTKFVIKISDIHFGIGSDGVILIKDSVSSENDFKMEIYNADGSQAEMCGNGIRCVGKFVYDNCLTDKKSLKVETLAGIKYLDLTIDENNKVKQVTVNMGPCEFEDFNGNLNINQSSNTVNINSISFDEFFEKCNIKSNEITVKIQELNCNVRGMYASMGNPHFVIFVDNVDDFEVEKYGPYIEKHKCFPNKINVEFIQVINKDNVKMRVWERGSGETFACGTGACAVFSVCNKMGLINNEATIILRGGNLEIKRDLNNNNVYMKGPATEVCKGTI